MQSTSTVDRPATSYRASTPTSRPTRSTNHQTAIFLVICLGLSGSSRFYLGYRWSGIAKLICNAGFLLALIALVVYFTGTVIDQLELDQPGSVSQSQSILVDTNSDQTTTLIGTDPIADQTLERDDSLFYELWSIYLGDFIGLDNFEESLSGLYLGFVGVTIWFVISASWYFLDIVFVIFGRLNQRRRPNCLAKQNSVEHQYDYSVAVFLSFFFGFLGADRFYLGHKLLGSLKFLTGGGLGLWWAVDFILICANKIPDSRGHPLRCRFC